MKLPLCAALPCLLVLGWAILLGSCTPPTSDPDQALRDLITSTPWMTDPTFVASGESDTYIRFNPDGSAYYHSSLGNLTWTYKAGLLTVTTSNGTSTTANPDISKTHFYCNVDGSLRHLIPAGS